MISRPSDDAVKRRALNIPGNRHSRAPLRLSLVMTIFTFVGCKGLDGNFIDQCERNQKVQKVAVQQSGMASGMTNAILTYDCKQLVEQYGELCKDQVKELDAEQQKQFYSSCIMSMHAKAAANKMTADLLGSLSKDKTGMAALGTYTKLMAPHGTEVGITENSPTPGAKLKAAAKDEMAEYESSERAVFDEAKNRNASPEEVLKNIFAGLRYYRENVANEEPPPAGQAGSGRLIGLNTGLTKALKATPVNLIKKREAFDRLKDMGVFLSSSEKISLIDDILEDAPAMQ